MAAPLPLDLRTIPGEDCGSGKRLTFPALHETWKEEVLFPLYKTPLFLSDPAAVEEWLENAASLEEDLHWLLHLTHHRFWSQLVHDETLQATIDSYLQSCPRLYDDYERLPQPVHQKQLALNELFFRVIMRSGTCKESQEFHITPSAFGNMLYNTYLMDIPKIMDICAVFGNGNEGILSRWLAGICRHQPKYLDDLYVAAGCIHEAFESIIQRCAGPNVDGSVPLKLEESTHAAAATGASVRKLSTGTNDVAAVTPSAFEDLVLYAFDVVFTLKAFVDVYPAGSKPFHDSDFYPLLASFHDEAVGALLSELRRRKLQFYRFYSASELKTRLALTRCHLLKIFRCMLSHNCLLPLMDRKPETDETSLIEQYLAVLSASLSERKFLQHYNRSFPLEDDFDMFVQMGIKLDDTRLEYIRLALVPAESSHQSYVAAKKKPLQGSAAAASSMSTTDIKIDNVMSGACASALSVSEVELASLVSSVRDLLPDLGEGFVQKCLVEYNYNVENVVNAILEDSLPSVLRSLDRSLAWSKEPTCGEALANRKNIYDNDEFDVFSRSDIDQSKVHKGKRSSSNKQPDAEKQLIADKVKSLAAQYEELDLTDQVRIGTKGLYDDEYDDTYDANGIGADDIDSPDELMGRPLVQPRVLSVNPRGTQNESDDESQETAAAAQPQSDLAASMHIRNPEHQRKVYDVKGRARGQGQTAEVLHNRAFKERHKGRGANHNRKAMADRKMQKGMF